MVAIVIAVTAILIVGGFLYLLAAVIGEGRSERDSLNTYYVEMLAHSEINQEQERQRWAQERASLLERIQRPEQTPPTPFTGPEVVNDEINDDLHLVGTVVDDPDEAA